MENDTKNAKGAQSADKAEVKKLPNFFVKDQLEKEFLSELIKSARAPFLDKMGDGYPRKLAEKLVDDLEGKLNKSLGK
jgi:hypothetical protein